MARKICSWIIVLGLVLPIAAFAGGNDELLCDTKYPVILVHGISMSETTLGFDYWGRIPDTLEEEGAIVYKGNTDPWSSHLDNADILKATIEDVLDTENVSKVNIIAHSKGGLESRTMFYSYPEMADKVASFTTMNSPHRGSVLADLLMELPDWAVDYLASIVDIIGYIQGQSDSDSETAGVMLTSEYMSELNDTIGDLENGVSGVYCQSYASKITGIIPDAVMQTGSLIMTLAGESPNDGAVWTESAPYANFREVISGEWWCGGVSHFAAVDRGMVLLAGGTPGFDARDWYTDMVSELKDMGY